MIAQHIYLDKYDWYIIIFYIIDYIDKEEILDELKSINCDELILEGIEYNLDNDVENTGFTYSNPKFKTTIALISHTDSAAEFNDSYDHEKGHIVMHIAKAFDLDPYGEEIQYLNGAIGYETFPVAKYFLCDNCRKRLYEE